MSQKIILMPHECIDAYEATARVFFQEILGLSWDEVLVTDESSLRDFSSCGLPDDWDIQGKGLKELYEAWDQWVVPRINERYDLALDSTRITLISLFASIEASVNANLH